MSSTAVPELSNELAQAKLQSSDGPVGSLAQTHALSSLPVVASSKLRKTVVEFYDNFSSLLDYFRTFATDSKKPNDALIAEVTKAIQG